MNALLSTAHEIPVHNQSMMNTFCSSCDPCPTTKQQQQQKPPIIRWLGTICAYAVCSTSWPIEWTRDRQRNWVKPNSKLGTSYSIVVLCVCVCLCVCVLVCSDVYLLYYGFVGRRLLILDQQRSGERRMRRERERTAQLCVRDVL